MRLFHYIPVFVASLVTAAAQTTDYRFIIDSPGPGYRDMAGTDKPQMDPVVPPQAILTFQPKDISSAALIPADTERSQILVFLPT